MRKKSGFTLIELLIVIAIIAIAASLLLPALFGSFSSQSLEITVDRRENHRGTYLIWAKRADGVMETFKSTDNWLRGKTNASDVYGQLVDGRTYRVLVCGYRIPIISAYRNVLRVESEVKAAEELPEVAPVAEISDRDENTGAFCPGCGKADQRDNYCSGCGKKLR